MNRRIQATIIGGLICVFALCLSVTATHTVDLVTSNSIPCYCQEDAYWCAAGTSQMILEGYPSTNHVYTQNHIYNTCQANNGDAVTWSPGTDPIGVRDTLDALDGSSSAVWVIYSNPSAQSVMWKTSYYMTKYGYPTAVLVDSGNPSWGSFDHWVAITGFVTDVDPTSNFSVTLQSIDLHDPGKSPCPSASSGGIDITVSGSTWYSTYWATPGSYSGSDWDGEYVVVVEPPEEDGVVRAPAQRLGPGEISPEDAIQSAQQWIDEQGFAEREEYAALRYTVPVEPILADPQAEYTGSYYIVPFVYEETEESPIAVLVNAFTGEPQEIGAFAHSVSHIREHDAFVLARRYLCLCWMEEIEYSAELAMIPIAGVFTRFLPVWRVTLFPVDQPPETVFVFQNGDVIAQPTPSFPGD